MKTKSLWPQDLTVCETCGKDMVDFPHSVDKRGNRVCAPSPVSLVVMAGQKVIRAFRQGGWSHAIWCNFSDPNLELKSCNCGLCDLNAALDNFYSSQE